MITKGLENFDVESFEYGQLVEVTHKDERSFKMHIPKLMAGIPRTAPKETKMTFNNNMFLNDAACKPSVSTSILTKNYVHVPRHYDRGFSARANDDGYISAGTTFILHLMHGNIRDMKVDTVI